MLLSQSTLNNSMLKGAVTSPIKSMQTGTFAITSGASNNITINAVDTNKAIVLITFRHTSYVGSVDPRGVTMKAKLVNATTVNLSQDAFTSNYTVQWTVIEFNNVRSLQRGEFTLNNTTGNVTISSINPNKSFLYLNHYTNDVSNHTTDLFTGYLSSATQITLERSSSNAANINYVAWQVVEFY